MRPYNLKNTKTKQHFCQCNINQTDVATEILSQGLAVISDEHFETLPKFDRQFKRNGWMGRQSDCIIEYDYRL